MRIRTILAAVLAGALAVPALAQAQPNRHRVAVTVAPGKAVDLTFGTVPRGEFRFALRVASDGPKRLALTQKRDDGVRFAVLRLPSAQADDACRGAAGSLFCTGVSTPVTPGGHSWNIRLRNRSGRPMAVALTVVWRPVQSAG